MKKILFSFPYGMNFKGNYGIGWHECPPSDQADIALKKLYNILEETFNVQWQSKKFKENFKFKNKEDEDYFLLWAHNGVEIEI